MTALLRRPDLAVLASACIWGTIWIPIREINVGGLESGLAAAISAAVAALAFLPFVLIYHSRSLRFGRRVWFVGLLLGGGIALYWEGMVRAEVARVVLLFYLMPVWTVLLARLLNGERITGARALGVALGVAGMAVVFSADGGLPLPTSIGDFMGLASGMMWAFAFVICAGPGMERTTGPQLLTCLIVLAPTIYALSLIPGLRETTSVSGGGGLLATSLWLVALALIWLMAGTFMTLYGAAHLSPGRVAIVLMAEVIIALVSSALLIDEPFGLRQVLGALLIVGAGIAEYAGKPTGGAAPQA